MSGLVDGHCHILDEDYSSPYSMINSMKEDNLSAIIISGYSLENSIRAAEIAEAHENVYASVGIHPHNVSDFDDSQLGELLKLAENKKVVAIGEIGLDYHFPPYDKDLQKEIFIAQIEVAKQANLPIVIHSRDATKDVFDIVEQNIRDLKGVIMHCFSESLEMAKEYIKLGAYLSIAGPVTYKNARSLVDVVKFAPINRLLSETDCPYLTPHPFRGQLNYPKNVKYVVDKIAEIKELSTEEVRDSILDNYRRIYNGRILI